MEEKLSDKSQKGAGVVQFLIQGKRASRMLPIVIFFLLFSLLFTGVWGKERMGLKGLAPMEIPSRKVDVGNSNYMIKLPAILDP
jgi:hypothetical protein